MAIAAQLIGRIEARLANVEDPVEGITSELISEGTESGRIRPVHAAFLREAVGLLVEATTDGRLQTRTGLSPADAFSELDSLVLRVLQRPVALSSR